MKLNPIFIAISACLLSTNINAQQANQPANQPANQEKANDSESRYAERIQILGAHDKLRTQGGATSLVSEATLEKFEFDDINKVLASVPGVNIREEDGYGLRPNIGFRGSTPERSKKISLMEDGVLISPAPYSAPSAYYFPMVSRMTAVEVFKGPAAIKYGPNTVAGALNLVTRSVPTDNESAIDLAYGTDNYNKAHLHHGQTVGRFGYLVEGLYTKADGFKSIDFSDADTGFEKSDLMAKFKYDFSGSQSKHFVELKLAYAQETSDETYLGLTDADFNVEPNRRYAATQKDKMQWTHDTVQLTHYIELGSVDLITRIYQHDFARDWRKVSSLGQGAPSLLDVLIQPDSSEHQKYYQILSGQQAGDIILGTNDRSYQSKGIQSDLSWQFISGDIQHKVDAGIRLHQDYINRDHFEETFSMSESGTLGSAANKEFTSVNQEKTDALSVYLQDAMTLDNLTVTAGIRGEYIDARYQNRKNENDWLEKESRIWLPSLSAFYKLHSDYGVFAGVHQGYVPSSPQQNDQDVEAEKSINYEMGFRLNNGHINAEIVAFYNDYSNLKESCTFSQSSNCPLDSDFNGGNVNVYGLEAHIANQFTLTDALDMPWSVTYSYTRSEFEDSFVSDYPQWGAVEQGDSMPYQPDHSLTLSSGLAATNWQLNAQLKYTGEMLEAAGDGVNLSGKVIEASTILDISASYYFPNNHTVYLKADNITEETHIVSRRPNGARPGKPRQLILGYKFSF
ncbi:TonB-dependent receptor family protein [Catenovulum sediminis]|uniref:TonB-dependent receptor n=1 Tax=Catenovulum sediminis TaxID=1740262 RepID=A0ABV1RJC7_9ALTE|nr:TonB-dependent receptor [Catenovulum sediminis]